MSLPVDASTQLVSNKMTIRGVSAGRVDSTEFRFTPMEDLEAQDLERVCRAIRDAMREYGAPLDDEWIIDRFVPFGETWIDAPEELLELCKHHEPCVEEFADQLCSAFVSSYMQLETIGTPQALRARSTVARNAFEQIACTMCRNIPGEFLTFEVENLSYAYFDSDPRFLERTRGLVGIFELVPIAS